MQSEISIRPAPASHKAKIMEACRTTFEEHRARQPFAFPNNTFEVLLENEFHQAFKDETGKDLSESPVIFVAEVKGEFAGYVLLSSWARPTGEDMPYVHINDIYVVPQFRGSGIAKALLEHVKERATENDWDNLRASVWTGNNASRKVFTDAGFVIESETLRFGPDRQARDYPTPATSTKGFGSLAKELLIWAAIALAVFVLTPLILSQF